MQQQLFEKFAAYVEARFGIRLPDEKKTLLETRLFKLFSSSQEPELADEESFFAYCCCSPFLSLPCPRHLPKPAPMFCRITA